MSELSIKTERIQGLLEQCGLDALLLRTEANFAWATCGAASHVNLADTRGRAELLYTPNGRYLLTTNIEAARLLEEEPLAEQGWEVRARSWYEAERTLTELTKGLRVGADDAYPGAADVADEMARLRGSLLPEETDRFRQVAQRCAEALDAAILMVRPGLTEQQAAGMLAREAWVRGVEPIVNLVGADERVSRFRHPLPTSRRVEKYAMLALGGRRWGLVASITRLIHFGRVPEDLRERARAVAQVDAHLISATRPGARLAEILLEGIQCYELYGFAGEWELHHQGGRAGYLPREVLATPGSTDEVQVGQAYAWNPSITGVKSEDTILVGAESNEVLTAIPRWPSVKVNIRGQSIERPLILEVS